MAFGNRPTANTEDLTEINVRNSRPELCDTPFPVDGQCWVTDQVAGDAAAARVRQCRSGRGEGTSRNIITESLFPGSPLVHNPLDTSKPTISHQIA